MTFAHGQINHQTAQSIHRLITQTNLMVVASPKMIGLLRYGKAQIAR